MDLTGKVKRARQKAELEVLKEVIAELPCAWCYQDGTQAGYYHLECARKMVDANIDQYRRIVLDLQRNLRHLYKLLRVYDADLTDTHTTRHQVAVRALQALQRTARRCVTTHTNRR